jgi:hypothetical protein
VTDDEAEPLARVAAELVCRVREFGTADNARWLHGQLPHPGQWFQLAFLLAAAVPTDVPWRDLTAWTEGDRVL